MLKKKTILISFQILLCFSIATILLNDSLQITRVERSIRLLNINDVDMNDHNKTKDRCVTTKSRQIFTVCPHNSTDDIYISKGLHDDGVWEPEMTKIMENMFSSEINLTFIDVGANIGYFSLLAASYGHKVIAIEPIANNIQLFYKAIVFNKFEENITLLQNVISDLRQEVTLLCLDKNNQGAARILNYNEFTDNESRMVTAAAILLDDLIGFIQTTDVIIKIDVEGHECKVLAGASQLLTIFNTKAVFVEWQNMAHRKFIYGSACGPEDIQRLANQIEALGLKPYDIKHGNRLDVSNSVKWTVGDVVWIR